MKYYYSKIYNDKYDEVSFGRNIDMVKDDTNKIIIFCDYPIFHVMTYKHPFIGNEKLVLDYPELVNYLQQNKLDVYFLNTKKDVPVSVINHINSNKKQEVIELPIIPESFYTKDNCDIVKISAYIDREIIKKAIKDVYFRELYKDKLDNVMNDKKLKFKKVPFENFIFDNELLNMYNLPLLIRDDAFIVPTYSYTRSNIFYFLNSIYSKLGDNINLSESDIKELYMYLNSEYKNIVNNIINKIQIEEEKRLDINTLSNLIENNDIQKQDLNESKRILLEANNNEEMIANLGLLDNKIEKRPVTK